MHNDRDNGRAQGAKAARTVNARPDLASLRMVIEGESKAAQYLVRVWSNQARVCELVQIAGTLEGLALLSFFREIERALGVPPRE